MAKQERTFRRSYDDMKERASSRGGGFDTYVKSSYKMYKVKDGKNLLRILPPTWAKAKHYGYDIWVNYQIGPDNQSYLSLSKMKGEPDPLAEARREADRADDEETARALQPRQRVLMWVIDRDAEDDGPQLWAAPFTVDKDIINISIDDDTKEVTPIDDPEEGCDLRFYKEGSGLNTKYPASKMKLMEPAPLSDDGKQLDAWLDYVEQNPVPDCLQFYSYDHIAQVFNGHAKKKDPDDERPARRARQVEDEDAPRPKVQRPDPADPDDEPPFDTGEKPTRKPRARLDTEDEETAPRRTAAKPSDEDEGGSIRERLRRRRQAQAVDDAD